MILYRWQGRSTNFGDELNTLLWPALLPGLFDEDPGCRFLGIGSVLDARHPCDGLKLVAGSGYGGYEAKPALDRSWIIHWVRGPRTAAALGLPPSLALGDPAVLLPSVLGLRRTPGMQTGFMPHFESAERGAWKEAARAAGVRLLDPRDPPLQTLRAMVGCALIVSEALHGIIVADALRIPWVAVRPMAAMHRSKWADWSATMDLSPRLQTLTASTWQERIGAGPLMTLHAARSWLDRRPALPPSQRLLYRASEGLARAAAADPQLSADSVLDRCRSRMLDAVQAVRACPLAGKTLGSARRRRGSYLRQQGHSAYEVPVTG